MKKDVLHKLDNVLYTNANSLRNNMEELKDLCKEEKQHGFTSCLTNLLEMLEDWTSAMKDGYGIALCALRRAFSMVYTLHNNFAWFPWWCINMFYRLQEDVAAIVVEEAATSEGVEGVEGVCCIDIYIENDAKYNDEILQRYFKRLGSDGPTVRFDDFLWQYSFLNTMFAVCYSQCSMFCLWLMHLSFFCILVVWLLYK